MHEEKINAGAICFINSVSSGDENGGILGALNYFWGVCSHNSRFIDGYFIKEVEFH